LGSKNRKSFEKYILKIIDEYTPVLLLQRHTFKVKRGVEDKRSLFECLFNYPYLNVTIKYSDSSFKKWEHGKDLVPYIVHEMCHPVTDPLYQKALYRYVSKNEVNDEREILTDHICNIALNKYKNN